MDKKKTESTEDSDENVWADFEDKKDEFSEFRDAVESQKDGNKDGDDESQKEEDNKSSSSNANNDDDEEDKIEEERRKREEEKLTEEERESRRKEALVLKKSGNEFYLRGENTEALEKYEESLSLCPIIYAEDRSMIYANMGAAHQKMGLKEKAIQNCSRAIRLNPDYIKALVRRGNLYEESDKPHEALADFNRVLTLDPKHIEALCAARRLPEKVKEKDEKLKEEMMTNLKKLGNLVLNPFGLSTDNFNLVQDPKTGGYSVNFSQGGNKS